MFDQPRNSLVAYAANPLFEAMDFSHVRLKDLVAEISACEKQKKMCPQTAAVTFYLLNHGMHVMRSQLSPLTPLNAELAFVAEAHITQTNTIAKRMLCHTILSTVVEMHYLCQQRPAYYQMLADQYGDNFAKFAKDTQGSRSHLKKLDTDCGNFAGGMMSIFSFSDWAYRKPWTKITGLVYQCVKGEISLENFTDQSLSLCHWGGSILNKCHLFHCNNDDLFKILDVQDSGQIPQWVGKNLSSSYVSEEMKRVHAILMKYFPDQMTGPINQALIQNSAAKRAQMVKQINLSVQNNFAAGNNNAAQNAASARKDDAGVALNKILLGDRFKP